MNKIANENCQKFKKVLPQIQKFFCNAFIHNQSKMHLLKRTLMVIALIASVRSWNERVTCKVLDSIVYNPRFQAWSFLVLLQKPDLFYKINQLRKDHITAHLHRARSPIREVCSNWITEGQSCCNEDSFMNLTKLVNQAYDMIFERVEYPIFAYFRSLRVEIETNLCLGQSLDELLNENKSTIEGSLQQHDSLIKEMVKIDRIFINQTLCFFCLGKKDFPNYIYPSRNSSFHDLIYNQQYFKKQIEIISRIYLQLEDLHPFFQELIMDIGRHIDAPTKQCQRLKKQSTNSTFLKQKKLCLGELQCKKLAVRYYGEAGAPQNTLFIKQKAINSGIAAGQSRYVLSSDPQVGYKGNEQSQNLYGTRFLPKIKILNRRDYSGLF